MAARVWVERFVTALGEHTEPLNRLDRLAGDGDFGTNMRSAVGQVAAKLAADNPTASDDVFTATSAAFLDTGGTSGPLLGMWFRGIARAASSSDILQLNELTRGVRAGTQTVQKLGGAQPGDRTMVDAMVPAVTALAAASDRHADLLVALTSAAKSTLVAAEDTAALRGRLGRSSYVGEHARGVIDPGALTIAIWFACGLDDWQQSPAISLLTASVTR